MSKKEATFNDLVRKVRKQLFGKGPERIKTYFIDNLAITILQGNLTPTEKFIARSSEGKEMVHAARTRMIQEVYAQKVPEGLEELAGSKLLYLFNDIKVEDDIAVSVFIFEKPINK
ncbi:DUF2294 domain-containing protein [Parageobacillus toebii NBRC 107807]|uniref:Uncharacterized protein YbcI n=1 Tax=Parageobacillus toebii NBRC 107807 TaxID=1223503 RepID=A0A6G9J1I0_9BACL|nr:DUF2294 domain-containing protein [Parageobacillus toebii]MBB3868888.1 uncharacterized protein YbcI [Parageobacillus toebii NBRC 107807]QIQ32578.1 DUF2294 domain-containing protein [Parageobacillus toebii NBRC 107807]